MFQEILKQSLGYRYATWAFAVAILTTQMTSAETEIVYVATDGSDDNSGTINAPVKSLAKAQMLVRSHLQSDAGRDVTVFIRKGTYYLDEPLMFSPDDCATGDHRVTYAAATGEEVVISGGRTITGWKKTGDFWGTELPDVRNGEWHFRELFVNGLRCRRARHPNDGYFRVEKAGPDDRTRFHFGSGDLKAWPDIDQVELVFLHDWSTSRVRFNAISETDNTASFVDPIGSSAPHYSISHFEAHPRYFVENSRAFLDVPAEWYLDRMTGSLLYCPRNGEVIQTASVVAPKLQSIVSVSGDLSTRRAVRGLCFRGLTFAHCGWDLPAKGYAAGQAGFHDGSRYADSSVRGRVAIPAAVTFDLADDCLLENCHFEHLGGAGLYLRQTCRRNRISRCVFRDIAGNGVMIGETFTRKVASGGVTVPDDGNFVCRGNVIEDSTIENCGTEFFGCVGIWVGIAAETVIAHNEIRNLPYTGVSVGWSWNPNPTGCRGNRVDRNHIHHVMQILSDGGGIYTLGRQPGTILTGNVIHDVPLNAGRAESNGMFLDEGTTELVIAENLIYATDRSPLRFHRAEVNRVAGNIFVTPPDVPIVRYNTTDTAKIQLSNNDVIESTLWRPGPELANQRYKEILSTAGPRTP